MYENIRVPPPPPPHTHTPWGRDISAVDSVPSRGRIKNLAHGQNGTLLSSQEGGKLTFTSQINRDVLLDFLLTVKAATLIFISGRGSAISSAKEGKLGFIYNLVKSE